MAPLCLFWPGEKADRGKKDIALCIRLVPWSECHERMFPHTQVYHTWKCMRNALMTISRGMCMSPPHRDLPTAPTHVRTHPSSTRPRPIVRLTLNTFFLSLLLFTSLLSGWGFSLPYAVAAGRPHAAPANMTFKQFLQQAPSDRAHRTPFVRPQQVRSLPLAKGQHVPNPPHLPPRPAPATIQPLTQ